MVDNIFFSLDCSCLDMSETQLKFAGNEMFCLPYEKFIGIICATLLASINSRWL